MQPAIWKPPIKLSMQEEQILGRIRRAKLFVFLRQHRHELFDESFQQELATLYRPNKRGHQPWLRSRAIEKSSLDLLQPASGLLFVDGLGLWQASSPPQTQPINFCERHRREEWAGSDKVLCRLLRRQWKAREPPVPATQQAHGRGHE